jgi:hypothetical protein
MEKKQSTLSGVIQCFCFRGEEMKEQRLFWRGEGTCEAALGSYADQIGCQNRMGWGKEILGSKENYEKEFGLL